jgi:DNA-binding transcriptional LysR family regulator
MKTKLDYYRIFYETARYSSFSTAATHLYISQSAISQCIQQLERDLKTTLFIRTRKGVTLTQEGRLLFQKIEAAISSIEQGETILERISHLESGTLKIAAGDTIVSKYLLPYLEKFHALYPDISIELANSYSSEMLKMVKDGNADLAFVNMPAFDDELCIEPCMEIHDIFISGADFKEKETYSWKEISELPLILLEKNSSSRSYIDNCFKTKKIELKPQIEIAAHHLLIQFASIHLGISCVIKEFSKNELASGSVKELNIQPSLPSRSIGYAYMKNGYLSVAAKEFLKLIGKETPI